MTKYITIYPTMAIIVAKAAPEGLVLKFGVNASHLDTEKKREDFRQRLMSGPNVKRVSLVLKRRANEGFYYLVTVMTLSKNQGKPASGALQKNAQGGAYNDRIYHNR